MPNVRYLSLIQDIYCEIFAADPVDLPYLQGILSEQKKREKMDNIYFDTLPAVTVASNKTTLENYDALGMHLCTVVGPEMARLGCECPEPGYCSTISPTEFLHFMSGVILK